MRAFFEKINTQDYSVRRRWLVTLSAVSSIIVILIWFMMIKNLKKDEPVTVAATPPAQANILETIGDKFNSTWETMKDAFGDGTTFNLNATSSPQAEK